MQDDKKTLARALSWERLDPSSYKNGAKPPDGRCYGLGSRPWPRIQVQIVDDPFLGKNTGRVAKISASRKEGPSYWWETCGIPEEILDEIPEMIRDWRNKVPKRSFE